MGGTGVASGSYGSGALINPALLAKAKPDDDVTVILPSVGVQVTDEDNLQDEIDTINDKINHYKDVVDNLTPIEVITNPLGSLINSSARPKIWPMSWTISRVKPHARRQALGLP